MTTGRIVLAAALTLFIAGTAVAKEQPKAFSVTAKLVDIPGKMPPDDLYDYAYVMKYEVIGGERDKQVLLVAHYKPRQRRSKIKGKMKKHVAGKLKKFKKGGLHALTLVPHSKKIWKGAMVDDYFAKDRKSQRYWCLRADPAKK